MSSRAEPVSRYAARGEEKAQDAPSLLKSVLDFQLLFLLYAGPKTGYDLRKRLLLEFHQGISYGTLYPHLTSFERKKLVTSSWDVAHSRRKHYTITPEGIAVLRKSLSEIVKIYQKIGP